MLPADIARMVDHTLLRPDATEEEVTALVSEAISLGVYSVCVSPSMLPLRIPAGYELMVATVCGFPSGKHSAQVKAFEAAESVHKGADEIDMVLDAGLVKAGTFDLVEAEVATVRAAVPSPGILKVIIESAALTDEEIVGACNAAVAAGADFVKTSTGFSKSGATVADIRLMRETVGPDMGVKASGGIRTLADALAMIEAGASRIGASASVAIVTGDQAGSSSY
jgi:deoxyribose-phosphate aldolase